MLKQQSYWKKTFEFDYITNLIKENKSKTVH